MSIKKLILLMGLSVLFAGCSTSGDYNDNTQTSTVPPTRMGMRYLLGRGVPQDDQKAFAYFSQASAQDDAFAQNELAYMYAAGKGTKQDYGRALFWYQKAADHDLASAQYSLGVLYLRGLGTSPNKEMARKWFKRSADHGFEPAVKALART
jgi:TPR repeat protein